MSGVSPAARLRLLLADERRRGTDFDEAWARALAVLEPREDWAPALAWSREEFRAAYEGRGSRFVALGPLERAAESATVVLA